ncbi:NAD(P)/FAD-dependent oxidoreductase [Micromonospora sp. NPDC050495]|uniref:flavin-containing monooxygenase n=1 Tax=Micromonospora sp. NPDC050495 TaxID=3154936 RepID=UPI0033D2EBF4
MSLIDIVVVGGGQSGLAAAGALRRAGRRPVILEAGEEPVGSWPRYYDSLTLFSPARYSSLPGLPFEGDPDRYPYRDEVVDYLRRYAATLDADIRTGQRVVEVTADGPRFGVHLADGDVLAARSVVAATGGFGRPHRPSIPGLDRYTGTLLHACDYRNPEPYRGQRVVIVGAGNSAVQIATELAKVARVTLATRAPVRFAPQRPLGRDLHFWYTVTGLDIAPIGRWLRHPPTVPVLDQGPYRAALAAGRPDRRPVFTVVDGNLVTWPGGESESVDAIILATGYRPDVGYLAPLGALDPHGSPRHVRGMSTTHPGLAFVGLEWQSSLNSASLRGVGRDARRVAASLAHVVRSAGQ